MTGPDTAPRAQRKWEFGPQDRIGIGRHDYVLIESTDEGHLLARLDNMDLTEFFSDADIERWRNSSGFRHDPGYFSPMKQMAREKSGIDLISNLPTREQAHIRWKYAYCEAFLRMERACQTARSDERMKAAVNTIHETVKHLDCAKVVIGPRRKRNGTVVEAKIIERKKPSAESVLAWIVKLEKGGFDLRVLRDGRYRSGNTNRIDPDMHALILRVLDGPDGVTDEKRLNFKRIKEKIEIEAKALNAERLKSDLPALDIPCDRTITKAAKEKSKFLLYAARHGIGAAKRRYPPIGLGFDVTRPMQRVEIDECKISLAVLFVKSGVWKVLTKETREKVRRVRVWLCAAIDVRTKCILGMRISESPTQENSLAVLKMIVSDKGPYADAVGALTPWDMCATPHLIASDNGGALTAYRVQTAIADLMSSAAQPPTGCPNWRPYIERVFGTVRTQLLARFTGQTFEHVLARGKYPAEGRASIAIDELAWALVRYVVDVYHNTPHEGLGGETPREAWLRLTKEFRVLPPPDSNRMRAIFGEEKRVKLGPHGLRGEVDLDYQSEALQSHFLDVGETFIDVRVDHDNLGAISAKLGEHWHEVRCVQEGMHGVSKQVWDATRKDLRRRFPKDKPPAWDIVLQTIAEIMEMSRNAVERAGLGPTILDPALVEKAKNDARLGFKLPDPQSDWPTDDEEGRDLLADALPTGTPETAPPPPPKQRSFKITKG